MEKVVFYRVYYFEDFRENRKYYFEDKSSCAIGRFIVYKRYDKERLSKNKFVVPVGEVQSVLISEENIKKIKFEKSINLNADVRE